MISFMVRKIITKLQRVPYIVFLGLFITSGIVAVYGLRHNNQTMVKLRSEVYATDQAGDDVNGALNKLREYVYGHMNTNLSSGGNAIKPPIQLKYTYERLVSAEQEQAREANSQIYTEAQIYCQAQNPASFSGGPRVPCVEDYVTSRGVKVETIPAALYKFDFISPVWSPDLAGWSLVLSAVLFMALTTSFLMDRMVKSRIKSQQL